MVPDKTADKKDMCFLSYLLLLITPKPPAAPAFTSPPAPRRSSRSSTELVEERQEEITSINLTPPGTSPHCHLAQPRTLDSSPPHKQLLLRLLLLHLIALALPLLALPLPLLELEQGSDGIPLPCLQLVRGERIACTNKFFLFSSFCCIGPEPVWANHRFQCIAKRDEANESVSRTGEVDEFCERGLLPGFDNSYGIVEQQYTNAA